MIRSFGCRQTEKLFETEKSKHFPPDILRRCILKLNQLDALDDVELLRIPPSNRLEKLTGTLEGKWSIRVNREWRLVFEFDAGEFHDVELTNHYGD